MLCVPHACWNNLYGVLFALAALVLYWWDRAVYGGAPRNPASLGAGAWLFLLMCLLCTAWARYPAGSLRVAVFFVTGFILAYLVAASFTRREDRDLLLGCITGALILISVYGLAAYFLRGETYFVPMNGRLYPRLSATLEHGINFSEFAAMALPLCLVWTLQRKGPAAKGVLTALLALPCAAVLLT